jgi:hypothetical protein
MPRSIQSDTTIELNPVTLDEELHIQNSGVATPSAAFKSAPLHILSKTERILKSEHYIFSDTGFQDTELAIDLEIHAKCSETAPAAIVSEDGKLRTYSLQKIPVRWKIYKLKMARNRGEMRLDVNEFENQLPQFPVDSDFLNAQSQNLDYNPPMAMDMTQLGLLREAYVERIKEVEVFEIDKRLDGNFSMLLLENREKNILNSGQLAEALVAECAVACSLAVKSDLYFACKDIFGKATPGSTMSFWSDDRMHAHRNIISELEYIGGEGLSLLGEAIIILMYLVPYRTQLTFSQGQQLIKILAKIIKPYVGYILKEETFPNEPITPQESSNSENEYFLAIKWRIANHMSQQPSVIELRELRSMLGAKFNSNLRPILRMPLTRQCLEVIIALSYKIPGGTDVHLDLDIAIVPYFKKFVCIPGSKLEFASDDLEEIGYTLSSQGYRENVLGFTIPVLLVLAGVLIWVVYASLTKQKYVTFDGVDPTSFVSMVALLEGIAVYSMIAIVHDGWSYYDMVRGRMFNKKAPKRYREPSTEKIALLKHLIGNSAYYKHVLSSIDSSYMLTECKGDIAGLPEVTLNELSLCGLITLRSCYPVVVPHPNAAGGNTRPYFLRNPTHGRAQLEALPENFSFLPDRWPYVPERQRAVLWRTVV